MTTPREREQSGGDPSDERREPERAHAARVAERLRAEGWDVVAEPRPVDLPPELRHFQLDLVAHRGDDHLVVEVRGASGGDSPSRSAPDPLPAIAGTLLTMPGWQLEVAWIGLYDPPASAAFLADRARRAVALVDADPEAALLLAWSAVEGTLARTAEREGVSSRSGGSLPAELFSRGLLEEPAYELLRDAQRLRSRVAHGGSGKIDAGLVRQLAELARTSTAA